MFFLSIVIIKVESFISEKNKMFEKKNVFNKKNIFEKKKKKIHIYSSFVHRSYREYRSCSPQRKRKQLLPHFRSNSCLITRVSELSQKLPITLRTKFLVQTSFLYPCELTHFLRLIDNNYEWAKRQSSYYQF